MHLTHLSVEHFRNIKTASLEFSSGINIISGSNGAGKTALLEAIHLVARGRSFRTTSHKPLIKEGCDQLVVRSQISSGVSGAVVAVSKSRSGVSLAKVNGEKVRRASEIARLLPLQLLLPGIADLVFDGPGVRRESLDWGLFHVEHDFLEKSRRYERALSQRGAWLRGNVTRGVAIEDDSFVGMLVDLGTQINRAREQYIEGLKPVFVDVLSDLDADLKCEMAYKNGGFGTDLQVASETMSKAFSRDLGSGVTHYGPHRGDLDLVVAPGVAKAVVSRGQAKLIALGLTLAHSRLLMSLARSSPVILLDDFGAELDAQRRDKLTRLLAQMDCQVIVTTADDPSHVVDSETLAAARVFHVEHGQIRG